MCCLDLGYHFIIMSYHKFPSKLIQGNLISTNLAKNNFVFRVPDLHMHPNFGAGGSKPVRPKYRKIVTIQNCTVNKKGLQKNEFEDRVYIKCIRTGHETRLPWDAEDYDNTVPTYRIQKKAWHGKGLVNASHLIKPARFMKRQWYVKDIISTLMMINIKYVPVQRKLKIIAKLRLP